MQMITPTMTQRSEVELAGAEHQRKDALAKNKMHTTTRISSREENGRGASTLAPAPLLA